MMKNVLWKDPSLIIKKQCQEKLFQYNVKKVLIPNRNNHDNISTTTLVNKGDEEISYGEDSDEKSEYKYAYGVSQDNYSIVNTCNHEQHPNDSL